MAFARGFCARDLVGALFVVGNTCGKIVETDASAFRLFVLNMTHDVVEMRSEQSSGAKAFDSAKDLEGYLTSLLRVRGGEGLVEKTKALGVEIFEYFLDSDALILKPTHFFRV